MKNKERISFGWESEDEKLRRYMDIPPLEKLKALRQMNEFTAKFSSQKTKAIRKKLREMQ